MATFYSNLYKAAPGAQAGAERIYEGPTGPMSVGSSYVVFGQFDNPASPANFGSNVGGTDVLRLCKVPQGARLLRLVAVPSADLDGANTFTFNLGWSSLANTFASASTGLQGATAFTLAADAVIASPAAADADDLILTRAAGALGTAGTIRFAAEFGH